jgi:enoyl-CoA hydratase/carnithine racemase
MGLNEVMIGIPVPMTWVRVFADTVGHRNAEKLLLTGKMPKTPELLTLGMVDEAVEAREMLLPAAEKVMEKWLKAPDPGRVMTKKWLRDARKQAWEADIPMERASVWKAVSDPKTVKALSRHPALASKATAKL